MQTRSQRPGADGSHATDWHALEVQLNRTRTILQEILLHLQEVLRNLKRARSSMAFGGARGEAGSGRARPQAGPQQQSQTFRAERAHVPPPGSGAGAGSAGASDRFRTRPRYGAGETGAGDRPRAEEAWSARAGATAGASGSRTTAGATGARTAAGATGARASAAGAGRERPRTESTWRARTTAGPEREARPGPGASARPGATSRPGASTRAGARPGPRPHQDFRMDGDRQRRAREVARKNGMNLKCAYDILCLDYPCSADEIKLAYRHMARLHHPDLGGDEEAMKDVNVAYELAMRFCAGARRTSTAWAV